jgi:hypothetical protein
MEPLTCFDAYDNEIELIQKESYMILTTKFIPWKYTY